MKDQKKHRYSSSISLHLCDYGMEKCRHGHFYGPAVRDHFLIHFIHSGKGTFQVGKKQYFLNSNQAFFIFPGILTYYEADQSNPWTYSWIGIQGTDTYQLLSEMKIEINSPILTYTSSSNFYTYISKLIEVDRFSSGGLLKLQGLLYLIIGEIQSIRSSQIIPSNNFSTSELYTKKAIDFIERNYSRPTSIQELVNYIGIERSYFSHLFKEKTGYSPQSYLIQYRIQKALFLLKNTSFSISDIARSVGYTDPLAFSKTFKKNLGISPNEYKKSR